MKYSSLFAAALFTILMPACDNKTQSATDKLERPIVVDTTSGGYNELANKNNRKSVIISPFNTDNKQIKNIKRPSKSKISTQFDTTLLFNVWTSDPNGPHADFQLTDKSFYIVDYDGNGDMPYELINKKLKIYYNDFIQEGEIISVDEDTLKIIWKGFDFINNYVKWTQ